MVSLPSLPPVTARQEPSNRLPSLPSRHLARMISQMHRSRLFWKLFATFVGLTLLATILLALLSYRWQRDRAWQAANNDLRQIALLARNQFADQLAGTAARPMTAEQLHAAVVRFAHQAQVRLTLLTPEGQVLADSTSGTPTAPPIGENQRHRPEIVAARAREQAFETRHSDAFGEPAHLFALRVDDAGFIRTSLRNSQITIRSEVFGRVLTMFVLAIALGATLLTYVVVYQLVRPLLILHAAAEAMTRGEEQQRVLVHGNDELAQLSRAFNRLSKELGTQLTQLRESDQRQAAILEGMVEGVIAVDQRERVLFVNAAAGQLYGFLAPNVQGRPLIEVIRDHTLHAAVGKVLQTHQQQSRELAWESDTKRSLSAHITPLPGGKNAGAVIVLHDNTELRRLETIRQEFVANVSHELKTPLSSILAYTETLLGGAIDDRDTCLRFLQRIEEQGERLHSLIQDMLHLAHIETAQQSFEIVPVELSGIVARCVQDYLPQAEGQGISLTVGGTPPKIHVGADEEGLLVILNNLVDNAVKYTPAGGKVELRWQAIHDEVLIEVSDTGPGIPSAEVDRVFERFYRVDKARSRALGSTGLGLSIVKHLAQSFGGSVGVESRPPKGSRFWVRLPVAVAALPNSSPISS